MRHSVVRPVRVQKRSNKRPLTCIVNNSNSVQNEPIDPGFLRKIEAIAENDEFEAELQALDELHPGHPDIWRARVRRLIKLKRFDEAAELIEAQEFGEEEDALRLIEKAELLHDARRYGRAAEIFERLLETRPESVTLKLAYAKRLLPVGQLVRARELVENLEGSFPQGNWRRALVDKILALHALLTRLESAPLEAGVDARILAMKHAILHFRDREVSPRQLPGLGRLTLITGSLGPGGAERQLTRLAIELERARQQGRRIGGISIDRPIEVLVRSHGPEKQNDFYLREVQDAGCELDQINLFKPLSNRELAISDPILARLIDYLPSPVNFGVRRLTSRFVQSGTETASIWQDGACLFAGLAALMAGVPHVQLAIRGLPPSMRRHMYRPEYEVLYRAMAEVPGVRFVSNSKAAARAYAEWLGLPLDRFDIVYNGVEPMKAEPSAECERCWEEFVRRTPGAECTIGGVFRFDTDKQPLLWIRFAARYLKRHPSARFVLVGGGRLQPNAEELARELGISDRLLFVGRSARVGYWMSKMDALVLLSRYEGLPNVLIEAQYVGVRVVTTPAGGASECVIDGTTGFVLECAEKPDMGNLVARVNELTLRSGDRQLFDKGGAGRDFLDSHFSIPRMLENYVSCTTRGVHAFDADRAVEDRRVA